MKRDKTSTHVHAGLYVMCGHVHCMPWTWSHYSLLKR